MAGGDRARWDARYRDRGPEHGADPSPILVALDDLLPRRGCALDVAGGAGRNACWLARRGLDVTIADVSPAGLERARAAAAAAGVTLWLVETDLETDPLPGGPYGLIVSIDFLCRALFAAFPAALAPGGLLVYSQATRTNLERHPHPGARFLLDGGELRSLVGGLEVLSYAERWFGDREHSFDHRLCHRAHRGPRVRKQRGGRNTRAEADEHPAPSFEETLDQRHEPPPFCRSLPPESSSRRS